MLLVMESSKPIISLVCKVDKNNYAIIERLQSTIEIVERLPRGVCIHFK